MRIERLSRRHAEGRTRVSALVSWERRQRPAFELFFEVEGPTAEDAEADPNAFLVACVHVASFHDEDRIAVEGSICPRLRDGVTAAGQVLALWHGARRIPRIEPGDGFRAPWPAAPREAFFLSGGIDSLDLYFHNRDSFDPGHPAAFRDAVHVFGLPFTGPESSTTYRNFFGRSRASASAAARTLGIPLTFVRTNLAEIETDPAFYGREQFGSAYASVAHIFARRFTGFSFAAQLEITNGLEPLGSHPLLDPCYATAALEFRHPGAERTRLEKVRAVAAHPEVLPALMTCHEAPLADARFNCGRCEKCVRTMAELWLAGGLDAAPFPADGLSPSAIGEFDVAKEGECYWVPLPAELRARGRADLARAVERMLERSRRNRAWAEDRRWKGALRRLDRRWLGGALLDLKRRVRGVGA